MHILKRDLGISPDESITRIYHQVKSGTRSPITSKYGALTGLIFYVNFSSITSAQNTNQDLNLEDFSNYKNHLTSIINRYDGKILNVKLDGITALFINGDPLNCALIMQGEHNQELRNFSNDHAPSIVITAFENDSFLDLFNETEYARVMRISQSAWEGQILITPQVLAQFDLPKGGQIVDLGLHTSNDSGEPIHILGLTHPL